MTYTNTVIRKIAHPLFIDNPTANISLYTLSRPKLGISNFKFEAIHLALKLDT